MDTSAIKVLVKHLPYKKGEKKQNCQGLPYNPEAFNKEGSDDFFVNLEYKHYSLTLQQHSLQSSAVWTWVKHFISLSFDFFHIWKRDNT